MTNPERRFLIGAQKKEGGSLDTSRAAIMIDGNDKKIIDDEKMNTEDRTFINPIDLTTEENNRIQGESKTEVELSNKRLINGSEDEWESKGAFGTVYAVDVKVKGNDKKRLFALKEYHGNSNVEASESVKKHRKGKDAGLRVWTTYRIAEDGKSVLISIGDKDGWKLIGDSNKLSEKEKSDFLPIANFDSFLESYYKDASKAANNHISICGDVPFFRVKNNNIDFVLGDMDQLDTSTKNEQEILEENLQNMHSRLVVFFDSQFGNYDEDEDIEDDEITAGEAETYVTQSREYIEKNFKMSPTRYNA